MLSLKWTIHFFSRFAFDAAAARAFNQGNQVVTNTLFIFACTNSVMNPIVYGFFNLRKTKTNKSAANNRGQVGSKPRLAGMMWLYIYRGGQKHLDKTLTISIKN